MTNQPQKTLKNRKKLLLIFSITILIIVILFIANTISNRILRVTTYEVKSNKINENFRIVMLTDLHNNEYGEENEILIEKIQHLNPDIIAMVGDMNLKEEEDTGVVVNLCEELIQTAPVYYSLGNHELEAKETSSILQDVEAAGAIVLDDTWKDVEIKNNIISIGGMVNFPTEDNGGRDFLAEFGKVDTFKLFLCHYSDFYIWGMDNWDVDLILSGHNHGGQIRIPFIGGVFAPEQGLFPEYVDGIHTSDKNTLIISRGVGNSSNIPRINNPPEIVVVDVVKDTND